MLEKNEVHSKILGIIQRRGPSLPMQIAREINMSSLFVSAFLSELAGEQKIRISSLKVGGSPLYYIPGQEPFLENFHSYLNPKEAEAFLLLKSRRILKDSEQEPAIRVALRAIRDFAKGFKVNEEIFWRMHTISEQEAVSLLTPRKEEPVAREPAKQAPKIKPEKPKPSITPAQKQVKIKKQEKKIQELEFENPLIIKEEKKPLKEKPKSDFVNQIIELINSKYKILEEKETKAKEYTCITEIKSELGTIHFYTNAKDKKTISDADIKKLLSDAQSIPLPAFLICTGNLSKKASELAEKYSSILKIKRIVS